MSNDNTIVENDNGKVLTKEYSIHLAFKHARDIFQKDSFCYGVEIVTLAGNIYFQREPFKAMFAKDCPKNEFGDFLPIQ